MAEFVERGSNFPGILFAELMWADSVAKFWNGMWAASVAEFWN